jgi:protein-disulfide isomerase
MSLRQKIESWATIVLSACAVVLTGTYVWRSFVSPSTAAAAAGPVEVSAWKGFATGQMQFGPANAPVTITEFSDFECPACRRLYRTLEKVREKYPNDVRIVYRNYPLNELHPNARAAAIAAECATDQGRFAEYYRYLFVHQDSLAVTDWVNAAASVGVRDTAAFRGCLTSPEITRRLEVDSLAAAKLDIGGTPLVLVNAWKHPGAPGQAALEKLIQSEIAKQSK